jgi:signal transduction histidine kinase
MLDETAPGSPLARLIDNIFTATDQAAQLTRQMLAYSGKGRFAVVPLSISKIVSDTASLLRASLPVTVDLRLNLAQGLPVIDGDSGQVGQLVANLALNGAEAIESAGVVTISASLREVAAADPPPNLAGPPLPPGAYVLLEVADTGAGMDEATLARMFDPFFSTKFTGRGLGLAAVLGIVRAHHGGISVVSAPQKGTTFQVFLPVERESARQAPSAEPQALHAKM